MITPVIRRAVAIADLADRTMFHLRNQLLNSYQLLSENDEHQLVLNAMGDRAAANVQVYAIALQALAQMDAVRAQFGIAPMATDVVVPDPEVYVINQDGTVTYVAPAPPEEPEANP